MNTEWALNDSDDSFGIVKIHLWDFIWSSRVISLIT